MRSLRVPFLCLSLLFLACTAPLRAESELDWDPEQTSVFVVGLLEWEHADIYSSFPACQVDRRDEQLVEYFRDAGVSEDRLVYLKDSEATKPRIEQEFQKLLDETDEGELLIVYFCGHGYRDSETDQTWFASYDAGSKNSSGWNVHSILNTIENRFSGNRALLLADCCHSGALYDEVRKLQDSSIAYAALTSSYAHNTSTGNWTFSDALLAGLRGEALVDLNGDEVVDLYEIAHYTEFDLAFIEGQKSMFSAVSTFPRKARFAEVEENVSSRVGERIEVASEGKWYKAKVIDTDGESLQVHYVNFDDTWNEWVTPDRIRPYQPAQFMEGDKVEVLWSSDQTWYPARVLRGWYGLHLVQYDGYEESENEWVGPKSIRLRSE